MSPEQATGWAIAYGLALFLVVGLSGTLLLLRINRSKKQTTTHHKHQ